MARSFRALILPLGLLAGCAHRATVPVADQPTPVAVARAAVPMPAGASPNMQIPVPLADGNYPTPSAGLSNAGALWHLRSALNVAALACRGTVGDTIATRYNALLKDRQTAFAAAQTALSGEYRKTAATSWQAAWDSSMTRLYNYYSLTPARPGFCAAADRVLTALAAITPGGLANYAPIGLAELDRPFTDFFRAYDAWRTQSFNTSVAMLSPAPVGPAPAAMRIPVLKVDPQVFR